MSGRRLSNDRASDSAVGEPVGTGVAELHGMDEESFQERLDNFEGMVRRQAVVIERLATSFHALLMVLTQKKVVNLDDVYAAERRLDLASQVAQVHHIANVTRDVASLDSELDKGDRRNDAA